MPTPEPMTSPETILVCDHRGEGLGEHLRGLEESGAHLEVSPNLRRSLQRLAAARPGVVLIDALAGGGVEIDALLEARRGEPPIPLLVVADPADPLPLVLGPRLLERGQWDLIRRASPIEEYELRIAMLLEHARRRREMDELRHRATHDDRTNLLRPLEFDEQVRAHASAAQRHGLDLALLFIDLDHFGRINKAFAHSVGDHVIEQVGEVIRGALRIEDVAGRLGGDEFGVLLPYTRKVDAAHVVQRLLDEIRALSGPQPGHAEPLLVSASIGFETFSGRDLESVEELRAHAERALLVAKRKGGDQGIYFRGMASVAEGEPEPNG
ncbi:MAG TPA: GGDEF domain-containing protein [Planctomycetota bacterium]|nr:GGDEF domain-containing protein [Planctomycetota bacterium]